MSTETDNTTSGGIFQPLNHMSLPEAALHYGSMGFKIFPLQPGSKLPMPGWSWKRIATSDADTIKGWWSLWPMANIALAMGVSGVDALDIDVKDGKDGVRSYQAITQEAYTGPLQQTPTGGQHMLFKHTEGLINFTHKGQLGGLDMRTTGGYIVAAPSITTQGHYLWAKDGKVPSMPPVLLDACMRWSTSTNTQVIDTPEIPEDLPDVESLGLQSQYLNYLLDGATDPWQHDESRAVFAVAGALMRRLQDAGLVYGIMCANPFAWACAERHRPFGDVSVWLWKYGIAKIIASVEVRSAQEVFSPLPTPTEQAVATPDTPSFFVRGSEGIVRANIAPQWIVRGLMERGQVGLVYGDSQALKSYLMLDLASAVTIGGKWHGIDVVAPGAVWFLAGEGNAILWRRLEALRQARGLRSEDLSRLWLSSQGLNMMNAQHLQFLRAQTQACDGEPPRLLIVDTLSSNAVIDENNAREAGELLSICYKISAEWGTTIVLVHHIGKGGKAEARGSSVWQANTDFRMRLERQTGHHIITSMHVEKLKGAPEPLHPLVFEAHVRPIVGVLDDDLVPVSDLVLERLTGDAAAIATTKKEQVNRGEKQREFAGHLREIITSHWSLAKPGEGMLWHELWAKYRVAHPQGKQKSNFDSSLDILIRDRLIEMRTEGDVKVLFVPGGGAA